MKLTKLATILGDLYTDLTPEEVRMYLQKNSSGGAIAGYANQDKSGAMYIAVRNVVGVYEDRVNVL